MVVYAGTGPERAAEVVELVGAEMDRLAQGGLTPRELAVARGHLRGDLALSLEDSAARMSRIGRSQLLHGEVLSVEEIAARIESVTLEQVGEVAARVLGAPRTLAVVGPFDKSDFS